MVGPRLLFLRDLCLGKDTALVVLTLLNGIELRTLGIVPLEASWSAAIGLKADTENGSTD